MEIKLYLFRESFFCGGDEDGNLQMTPCWRHHPRRCCYTSNSWWRMTGHGLCFYFIQLTAIRRFGSASTQPNVYVLRAFRKCTCCDSEIVRESDELNQIFFTFSLFHRLFVVLNLIKVYKVFHEMLMANLIFQNEIKQLTVLLLYANYSRAVVVHSHEVSFKVSI